MTTLTFTQALSQLNRLTSNGGKPTVQQLIDLAGRVNVAVPNATTTLLYAGTVNGLPNYMVAERIGIQNPEIAILDKTDAFGFVNNIRFRDALDDATDREGIAFEAVYEGKNPDGTRISNPSNPWYGNGVFDRISENFAANAVGDVRVIVPNASAQSVFNISELPTLLNNPRVTSIDGIPKAELLNIPLEQAFTKIEAASAANYSLLQVETVINVDSNGQARVNVTDVGDRDFFNTHPNNIGTDLIVSEDVRTGSSLLSEDARLSGLLSDADGMFSASTLNKLGLAGTVLATGVALFAAGDAWAAGDEVGAQNILQDFFYDTISGEIGSTGAMLALGGAIALSGASLPAGMIGVAIVLGVSIIGDLLGSEFIDIEEFLDSAARLFGSSYISPIIIDMDGDGLELVRLRDSRVNFDLDNNGIAERTGWLKGDDAFLVRDLNRNGVIDNQREMLGVDSVSSALDKLKAYDTNNDGFVAGAEFGDLRLWRDVNQNGRTDAGELQTLSAGGIGRLPTTVTDTNQNIAGHLLDWKATWLKADGSAGFTFGDIFFQTNQLNGWYVGQDTTQTPTTNPEALLLPLSRSYGTLKPLHLAATDSANVMNALKAVDNLSINNMSQANNLVLDLL